MKAVLALFILLLFACNQPDHKTISNVPQVKQAFKPIDTSIYTILKLDKANNYYFDKNVTPTTLSGDDILKIEYLVNKRVSEYNRIEKDSAISITKRITKKKHDPNFTWTGDVIRNPAKYYKQLIPIINSKGEKEVWVNCFCTTAEKYYWKKDIVLVDDGGSCFFNLKINLTKGTVYDFMVNGMA